MMKTSPWGSISRPSSHARSYTASRSRKGILMISSKDSADDLLDADPYLGYRDVLR